MSLIAFYYPNFAGPTSSWTPAKNPVYPISTVVDHPNLSAQTAGGILYVQSKIPVRENYQLHFEYLSQSDRNSLLAFYNVVQRELKTFEYKDPNGNLITVRIMNPFDFKLDRPQLYSGSISLRKE
mgnify:CR=1 FL=1